MARHHAFDGSEEEREILRAREAVLAILDEGEVHVGLGTAQKIDQGEGVAPGHVRVLHALENAHRTGGIAARPWRRAGRSCSPISPAEAFQGRESAPRE